MINLNLSGNDIIFMWSLALLYTLIRTRTFDITKDTSLIVTAIAVSTLINKFVGDMACIYIIVATATYMVVKSSIKTKEPDICLKKGMCEWKQVKKNAYEY